MTDTRTFSDPIEAIPFMAERLNELNIAVRRLEGENMALRGIVKSALDEIGIGREANWRSYLSDRRDYMLSLKKDDLDEPTAAVVDGAVACYEMLLGDGPQPQTFPFSVIDGGKSD